MTFAAIAAPLVGLVLLLAIVAAMIWESLMQRRLTQLAQGLEGKQYWRICFAPKRFPKLRNVQFIWKAHGLLVDDSDAIRLLKVTAPFSQAEKWVFNKQRTAAQWLAAKHGASSVSLDWLRLTQSGQSSLLFSLATSPAFGYPNKDELRDLALTLFPAIALPLPNRQVFGMQSGRRTIGAYAATAFLAIGALVDTFAINHSSLAMMPLLERVIKGNWWVSILLGAVCLSVAIYVFCREDEVPERVKVGNAMVIALALMVIAIPWAKRVDQWLPHAPAITYTYKVDPSGNLNPWPANDAMPLLLSNDLRLAKSDLNAGNDLFVGLSQGALGFWQVTTRSPALFQRNRDGENNRPSNFPWDLLFLPLMLISLVLPWQLQKKIMPAKRAQDRLAEAVRGQHFRRVELARPGFLQRKIKLIPYEALGILVDETTHIRLQGKWPDQPAPFDVRINKVDVKFLKNSSLWTNSPARVRVEVATPQGPITFVPDQSLANRQANGMAKQRSNDLIRSVFPGRFDEMTHHFPFALESSPMAIGVIFFSLAWVVWAAVDTYVLNPFALASELDELLPTHPMLWGTTLLLAFSAMPWVFGSLRRHKVPFTESVVLATMLGAGILTSSIPTAKRFDRHMATDEIRAYNYVRTGTGEFKPYRPGAHLPTLSDVPTSRDTPPPEGYFKVALIKGRLGFWQYDREHLLRDVYCKGHTDAEGCKPE